MPAYISFTIGALFVIFTIILDYNTPLKVDIFKTIPIPYLILSYFIYLIPCMVTYKLLWKD